MDDPVTEVPQLIHTLTQSPPQKQLAALNAIFTPTASFTHPFIHTGSWNLGNGYNSRWAISRVYRWYKIMCPRIVLRVDGVAVEYEGSGDDAVKSQSVDLPADSGSLQRLVDDAIARDDSAAAAATTAVGNGTHERRIRAAYATVRQTFGIWFVPFYRADVRLVVRLSLVYSQETQKYYVTRQEDCYPFDEAARFVWFGIWRLVVLWQMISTAVCVVLAFLGAPISAWEERTGEGIGGTLEEGGWAVKGGKGIEGVGDHGHREGEKKKSR